MNFPKVLFLVEGNTDIRFITGLSEISVLTMAIPERNYNASGLKQRLAASGAKIHVDEIPGGRLSFQFSSLVYLLRHAREFDVILCQEFLRGAFNGTLAGALTNTPAITYMGISPVEYFRCRRERGQIGFVRSWLGEAVIRSLMTFNGMAATKCLCMGQYLQSITSRYSTRTAVGLYYGVDTELYHPVEDQERAELRRKHHLAAEKFVIFLSSRISHEKDPETVIQATALARQKGLDAVVINLGGGYQEFLNLARQLVGDDANSWVLGRPAAHPMGELAEYYQASDCLAQASLAEGLGISPMEALACGIPAVCTAVGGLTHLQGYARMTPKRDPEAMCREFLWLAANREEARRQALRGRQYVIEEWSREKAFAGLASVFHEVLRPARTPAQQTV